MGHMIAFACCFSCKRPFGFNPHLVPSIRVNAKGQPDPNGEKEPICGGCMALANARRVAAGMPAHPILPGAYEPAPEFADNETGE